MAVLGQVEVADAHPGHEIARGRSRVVGGKGCPAIRLDVTFQIADNAMNDHTWLTTIMAIQHCLPYCYDDVNRDEVDKQMLSLGGKAHYTPTLQHVAHYALLQFLCTHLSYRLTQPTPVDSWSCSYPTGCSSRNFALYGSSR
jgi:hypothetical protein